MYQITNNTIKISVRNLVEFIMRSGDLDNSRGGVRDAEAMNEGSRIHRKIQKRMGSNYRAEFSLSITIPVQFDENEFELCVEGRADGIIEQTNQLEDSEPSIVIDEIKGMYLDLDYLLEPFLIHKAQVMCYAYLYGKQYEQERIGIRITYCNLETEELKYFTETLEYPTLETWFHDLINEYIKWASMQYEWIRIRNESIKQLEFPFDYRPEQKNLVAGVYKSIIRNKKLFIQAPTGVGKTISTIFPSVKAMGEGHMSKIFYLTAKTITRTVAEETYRQLAHYGLIMKVVTITAKEKICIHETADCNPGYCERAKGHFDRVNDAVFDVLTNENDITREVIEEYARRHMVCPFEMCLDVTTWADSIICDYNYAFDPNVYLRRFFVTDKKNDYVFLIDEAHNLVDRAREMYSAQLYKSHFLEVKKIIKTMSRKLEKKLETCNSDLLKLKRDCDDCKVIESITDFAYHLMHLIAEYEEFLLEFKNFEDRNKVLQLYLDIRHFLNIHDLLDEKYIIYSDYDEREGFRLKLLCMDPSTNLLRLLEKGRSAVFFSATLLPVLYYKEQLGGNEEDYAVYAPSPFDVKKRCLMIARDVSTKYSKRTESEFKKILDYIMKVVRAKVGNYLVFFPSYQFMDRITELASQRNIEIDIFVQKSSMTEPEREEFLAEFDENPSKTKVGFCVMGGIFSEGIDLKSDRLIGVVIVGTGLPMICNERELFREYYNEKKGAGFDYAYLYVGMNKVLQSAGRVIRTDEDYGVILLLDERFQNRQYKSLFPREWSDSITVDHETIGEVVEDFWSNVNSKE